MSRELHALIAGTVGPVRPIMDAGPLQPELWALLLILLRHPSSRQCLLVPSAGLQA